MSKLILLISFGPELLWARTQRTPGGFYLHVPRGSNNRLREATAVNKNDRRLFWANNNRRGGYNVGETPSDDFEDESEQHNMAFFMSNNPNTGSGSSYMDIEWSQLSGCGKDEDGEKIHDCNIKIQYMCQEEPNNLEIDDVIDTYTIRNGNSAETVQYKHEHGEHPDPRGACYRDNSQRDMPDVRIWMERTRDREIDPETGETETGPKNCQRRCKEQGYYYVGLQYGGECWCSNSYNHYGKVDDETQCNMNCRFDPRFKCGGPWSNNVYLTGLSEESRTRTRGENRQEKNERREISETEEDRTGLHESWEFYERCGSHFPNGGDGDHVPRSGFECWSERHQFVDNQASPWTDIAYLVDGSTEDCSTLQNMAWSPTFECIETYSNGNRKHRSSYTNQGECEDAGYNWYGFYKYIEILRNIPDEAMCNDLQDQYPDRKFQWGRPMNWEDLAEDDLSEEACLILPEQPACIDVHNTRANGLWTDDDTHGNRSSSYTDPNWNGQSPGELPRFKWRIPAFVSKTQEMQEFYLKTGVNFDADDFLEEKDQRCVMRVRQFVSAPDEPLITYANRQIEINGDPLFLAVPQWRTREDNLVVFEDRSHIFKLMHRPDTFRPQQNIHNIIVRGKRGNIVQTFPALEYDFSPNYLSIENDDAIHIQWTGSNSHDNDHGGDGQAGDDGEGRGGTDRNNFMQMLDYKHNFPMPYEATTFFKSIKEVLWAPYNLGSDMDEIKFSAEMAYASGGHYWCMNEDTCGDLSYEARSENNAIQERYDNVSPSFAGIVFIPGDDQTMHYMCLRNNNFSNRSQKGRLTVGDGPAPRGEPVPQQDHALSGVCGKPIYTNSLHYDRAMVSDSLDRDFLMRLLDLTD